MELIGPFSDHPKKVRKTMAQPSIKCYYSTDLWGPDSGFLDDVVRRFGAWAEPLSGMCLVKLGAWGCALGLGVLRVWGLAFGLGFGV